MDTRLGVRSSGWQGDVAGGGAGRRASRSRTGAHSIPAAQVPATAVPEPGPGAVSSGAGQPQPTPLVNSISPGHVCFNTAVSQPGSCDGH